MPLEATYNNPEVILTTSVTPKQQAYFKYIKCVGMILIAHFLVTFAFTESLLLSVSVVILLIALVMMVLNRPRVVMNNIKKFLLITGNRDSTQNIRVSPTYVDRVQVKSKTFRGRNKKGTENLPGASNDPESQKDPNTWYYTQVRIKSPKGKRKKQGLVLETFELQDILEAHYMAQLIAAFSDCKAFDVKGKLLPQVSSHIPTRYLKE